MDVLEAIYTRRSIRKFVNKEVSEELVKQILRAGMSAPNSGGQRQWQFIVVRNRNMLERIIEAYPYATMLREIPVAIIVCHDKTREQYEDRWQMDCANASYSILLAAHGLGLGGLWLEVYPIKERVKKMQDSFDLPDTITPLCVIAIGHADEEKPEIDRYDESFVHIDKW